MRQHEEGLARIAAMSGTPVAEIDFDKFHRMAQGMIDRGEITDDDLQEELDRLADEWARAQGVEIDEE